MGEGFLPSPIFLLLNRAKPNTEAQRTQRNTEKTKARTRLQVATRICLFMLACAMTKTEAIINPIGFLFRFGFLCVLCVLCASVLGVQALVRALDLEAQRKTLKLTQPFHFAARFVQLEICSERA